MKSRWLFGRSPNLYAAPGGGAQRTAVGPALGAGLLWMAVLISAMFWGLKLWGAGQWVLVDGLPGSAPVADVSAVARALGSSPTTPVAAASPAAVPAAARYRLIGVVSHRDQWGAALIAIDGQPPRPFQVGSELEPGWVLQAVERRSARLGPARSGPSSLVLDLPADDS